MWCFPNLKLKENLRKIVILKFDVILFCVGLFVENPSPSSYKCKTGKQRLFLLLSKNSELFSKSTQTNKSDCFYWISQFISTTSFSPASKALYYPLIGKLYLWRGSPAPRPHLRGESNLLWEKPRTTKILGQIKD